jgi:hypothetical protein
MRGAVCPEVVLSCAVLCAESSATAVIRVGWGPGAGRSLVRLDLSDNPMTAEAAPALAQALRGQPGLRSLNLNDTALGDEGVSAVAEARPASVHRPCLPPCYCS